MQIIDAAQMVVTGQTTTAVRPRAAPEAKEEEEDDEANVQDVRIIRWTITPLLVVHGIAAGISSARRNTKAHCTIVCTVFDIHYSHSTPTSLSTSIEDQARNPSKDWGRLSPSQYNGGKRDEWRTPRPPHLWMGG